MPVIHLVRHAQPDFHGNYDSLTPLGYTQARWLGQHYAALGIEFDRLYAGSLVRQIETARELRSCLATTPEAVIDDRFNEYDLAGVLGGYSGQADGRAGRGTARQRRPACVLHGGPQGATGVVGRLEPTSARTRPGMRSGRGSGPDSTNVIAASRATRGCWS
jgi:broad specificity phosphatase PhoE